MCMYTSSSWGKPIFNNIEMIFIQPHKLQASTFIISWPAWHKIKIEMDKAMSIIKQRNAFLMVSWNLNFTSLFVVTIASLMCLSMTLLSPCNDETCFIAITIVHAIWKFWWMSLVLCVVKH